MLLTGGVSLTAQRSLFGWLCCFCPVALHAACFLLPFFDCKARNLDWCFDRIRLCDCCPEGLKTFFLLLYRSSIGIMSKFFIVFAVHVAFLVTSLCAGVASVEAGIA